MYASLMTTDERPEGDANLKPLTRLTVNLVPKAAEALDHAAALTRDSRTDTVNRAIQFYDWMTERQAKGATILLRQQGEEELERIHLL